jgi:hypothetical protein
MAAPAYGLLNRLEHFASLQPEKVGFGRTVIFGLCVMSAAFTTLLSLPPLCFADLIHVLE